MNFDHLGPSREVVEIMKSKTPQERFEIASGMWRSARDMLTDYLRGEHPDWEEARIRAEVARRLSHEDFDPATASMLKTYIVDRCV
jgi:hypothetical protein